jgi:hypothetical protein
MTGRDERALALWTLNPPACSCVSINFVIAVWRAKKAESRRVKYWQVTLLLITAFFASLALADDFTTVNGKEYKDAIITRVEPDGIVIKTKSGIAKVYFVELPIEVQKRFGYDSTALQKSEALRPKETQQKAAVSPPMARATLDTPKDSFTDALAKLQRNGLLRLDCSRPDGRAWINPLLWATNDANWKENVTRNLAAYCHPKYPSIYILDAQSGRELASYGPLEGFKAK